MIVKQKSKVIPIEKSSTHYKMYKGGKLWLTAGITTRHGLPCQYMIMM